MAERHAADMLLGAAEALQRAGQAKAAAAQFAAAAGAYLAAERPLRAMAACKQLLDLDPEHTATQQQLAAALSSQALPLFSDLPAGAFQQLLLQLRMRTALPEEAIIREGDVEASMYIISQGRVKVTKTQEAGSDTVLAQLGEGAFFGEMALLGESPRTASVIALEPALLFEISRDMLAQLTARFPPVAQSMLRFYRQRLLANLMATSPLFRPLDAEQRRHLIERFKSRELGANDIVLEEGQAGDGLYMLLTGRAEVSKAVADGRRVLAHLKAGDVFGEMSLLQAQPVTARIQILQRSTILKLPRATFEATVAAHPDLLERIRAIAGERQKTTAAILAGQLAFSEDGLVVL